MESSFNLPNEVNSSNKRKSSKNNLEQNEMITGEYKRVNTASKRSNKDEQTGTKNDEPVWTENIDNVAGGAKTLAQHGTALKILKVVCVGVVVSTFISTAVFGGVIYNLMKRFESNERTSEALQSEINKRLAKTTADPANISAPVTDIETRLLNLEADQTQSRTEYQQISSRIDRLWLNQTRDRFEVQNIGYRVTAIESNLSMNTGNITYSSIRLTKYETIDFEYESNNTKIQLLDNKHRIGILELYQTQNRTDYGDVGIRIDNFESGLDTHESIIQNMSIRLMGLETEIKRFETKHVENKKELEEIRTDVEENQSNLTKVKTILEEDKGALKNLSRITTTLNMNFTTNYMSVLNLTVELSAIKGVLQREITNNGEYDITISQLELGWDFLSNIVQNHTTRITELEKDTSTDRSSIYLHEDKIAELTANLSLESSFVKANNDSITMIGSNLMQLETSSLAQNASLLIINDRLAQIEFDIAEHQEALELQGSSLTRVKNNLFTLNLTLQNHSSRMDETELDKIRTQDMIDINNLKLTRLETYVAEVNGRLHAEKDINGLQNRILLELTSLLNETRNALDQYNATSTNHTGSQIGFKAFGMNRILSDGSHVVQFDVTANFGFGYSSTTGKFICSHPGLYFFAATLIKRRNNVDPVDVLECFIDRNKSYLVKTYIDPTDDDTDNGSYETSAFVVVHLSQGDQVYVRCDDGKLDYESSFSGFLIQSD